MPRNRKSKAEVPSKPSEATAFPERPPRPSLLEIFDQLDEAGAADFELDRNLYAPVERDWMKAQRGRQVIPLIQPLQPTCQMPITITGFALS